MSYSSNSSNPPKIDKNRILEVCQVPAMKTRGIALYGSQVYGTNNKQSDLDFLVIACTMHSHKEFNDGLYNVHIKTPDVFYDELMDHKMAALECFYAPDFARIHEFKVNGLENFKIDQTQLKRRALAESHNSWYKAKRMINDGEMYRGIKSTWHSLRILMFADQILNEGCIYDFSEANNYWEEIQDSNAVTWKDFKKVALKKKFMLEDIIKHHIDKNIVIKDIKDILPSALNEDQLDALNTPRLLAYYKKKRVELWTLSDDIYAETPEEVKKGQVASQYLDNLKYLLGKRKHLDKKDKKQQDLYINRNRKKSKKDKH